MEGPHLSGRWTKMKTKQCFKPMSWYSKNIKGLSTLSTWAETVKEMEKETRGRFLYVMSWEAEFDYICNNWDLRHSVLCCEKWEMFLRNSEEDHILKQSLNSNPLCSFRNLRLATLQVGKLRMQLILNGPILLPEHFSALWWKRKG